MTIRISPITLTLDEDEAMLREKAGELLGVPLSAISGFKMIRKSLDARRKNRIHFVYTADLSLWGEEEERILRAPPPGLRIEEVIPKTAQAPFFIKKKPECPPIVVGTGPAGLFAALTLAQGGIPALVLERGKEVAARIRDVERFWKEGILGVESNVQFGEGGAGTFSDGKLYTRLNDPRISFILDAFRRFGAPSEILYSQKPHLGTDRLRRVVINMRRFLQDLGVEFRFQTKVTGLKTIPGRIQGVIINEKEEINTSLLLLALGHSARDTYWKLREAGVGLQLKPFAIGLRVEHPQRTIDRIQYGPLAGHPRLPPADYQLAYRSSQGRGVYSFCMCPGGSVIGASSEEGAVVTNGMSSFQRNLPWANSALVVSVGVEDFGKKDPLAGMDFQRTWEEKAYRLGGGNFKAPAQALRDFLEGRDPVSSRETSFRPGVTPARLEECLPGFVVESLREAIPYFHRKMPGFSSAEAMLIGIETRTSAPLRILRGDDYHSQNIRGLLPIGEGSGYAGGIISSALDGIKAAEAVLRQLERGA